MKTTPREITIALGLVERYYYAFGQDDPLWIGMMAGLRSGLARAEREAATQRRHLTLVKNRP